MKKIVVILTFAILLTGCVVVTNEYTEQKDNNTTKPTTEYVETTTSVITTTIEETTTVKQTTKTTTTKKKTTTTTTTTRPSIYEKNINFPTYNQNPSYPTGCEIIALHILLNYYGINTNPDDLIDKLDIKPVKEMDSNGEECFNNPEKVFVGNPRILEDSRGVYNDPIKKVADNYKKGAISKTGLDFKEVEKIVNSGTPVIIWATINLHNTENILLGKECGTDQDIYWQTYEHAMVLIATDKKYAVFSDPYIGMIRYSDKDNLIDKYNQLGKRVLYFK